MSFQRDQLPDPVDYFTTTAGLKLQGGKGKWRTTRCEFHGGSDSMRVNTTTGAFVCMAGCGAKGGDVLAYEMLASGRGFVDTAKALGAWRDDGHTPAYKPSPVSARTMLEVLALEVQITYLLAADMAAGKSLADADRERLLVAVGRIGYVAGEVAHA